MFDTETVFSTDLMIYVKTHDGFYSSQENKEYTSAQLGINHSLHYEGCIQIYDTFYPYADRFIESLYEAYGVSGMKTGLSEPVRERYIALMLQENRKKLDILLYNGVAVYVNDDINAPVIRKIIRRYKRKFPDATEEINAEGMVIHHYVGCTDGSHKNMLSIENNLLTGKFLAYESEYENGILVYADRITR